MSLGSKAILCPFSPPVYEVSGARSLFFGIGELTLLASSPSSPVEVEAPPPAPRRRVRPPAEAIGPDSGPVNLLSELTKVRAGNEKEGS